MAQEQKMVLEEGTPVILVLSETISSADERVGNTVGFEVVDDVKVGDIIVIPRGATAWGTVTVAEPKKRMGRGGKLDVNVDKVRLVDGEKVLLSAAKGGKGGGHTGAMVGAMVGTSLIIWPAAPFFLLMHGKDISIPKGTKIAAYILGDATLDPAKFTPAALVAKPVQVSVPVAQAATSTAQTTSPATELIIPATVQTNFVNANPPQESLGDVARRYKEKKEQQQTQHPPQPQQ
jgi:hypothetical protein